MQATSKLEGIIGSVGSGLRVLKESLPTCNEILKFPYTIPTTLRSVVDSVKKYEADKSNPNVTSSEAMFVGTFTGISLTGVEILVYEHLITLGYLSPKGVAAIFIAFNAISLSYEAVRKARQIAPDYAELIGSSYK